MHPQLLFTISPPPGPLSMLEEAEKREDLSEKINLDLGIGRIGSGQKENKKIIKPEKEESFFTAFQFHDFSNQILVYNFIASGLPIPFHLLLPIWTSVFNCYGSDIYKRYPSFTGFSPRQSNYSGMMDPEPGRCLRTDGRKWRCSKNVVPNQKYCERHMHRGRQGSRKLVESSEKVPEPYNKTSTFHNTRMPTNSLVTCDNNSVSNHTEEKDAGYESTNPKKIGSGKHCVHKNNVVGSISQGFGLSPKSVLQCGEGKLVLALGSNKTVESELKRCRRTDGKKWQCSRDAIPDQKYCESHMHRGAKKRALNTESASISRSIPRSPDNGINLNTMPGNHSTSSTSDATTITDETSSICRARARLLDK
ncbi:hypothetical protein ACJIZ3_016168 [Penstemon smallii]|uniref:Growth-regulating factor n=1 Tax=Penstemon smallii TaxID=265156 RepID=A0ABD3RPN8_9LAMI